MNCSVIHLATRVNSSVALLVLGLTALPGCGDDQDPDGASELYDRVRAEDYTSWSRAPGYATRQPTNAPHADAVEIFLNDVVEGALASPAGATEWPVGSIIVKDGYTSDDELEIVAVMEKRDDGWFWAEYDAASGESLFSGKPATCLDCHDSGSDFVRAFALP